MRIAQLCPFVCMSVPYVPPPLTRKQEDRIKSPKLTRELPMPCVTAGQCLPLNAMLAWYNAMALCLSVRLSVTSWGSISKRLNMSSHTQRAREP